MTTFEISGKFPSYLEVKSNNIINKQNRPLRPMPDEQWTNRGWIIVFCCSIRFHTCWVNCTNGPGLTGNILRVKVNFFYQNRTVNQKKNKTNLVGQAVNWKWLMLLVSLVSKILMRILLSVQHSLVITFCKDTILFGNVMFLPITFGQ